MSGIAPSNDVSTQALRAPYSAWLPLPAGLEPQLAGALRYVLDRPGNLARPRIVLQVAEAYSMPESLAMDLAMSLEYFHTASLLFDDMPAMDNATERRGSACLHKAFSESTATLAALAFVNRAYALAWRAIIAAPAGTHARGFAYLEEHLGLDGLLNGQSLDLQYASLPHTRETTERIALGKTVALIRLTLVLPALLAGAEERELQALERIALFWGLAYQILDDLKDVIPRGPDSGKTSGQDAVLDRPNITFAIGIDGARERLDRLIHLGDEVLERLLRERPGIAFLNSLRKDLHAQSVTLGGATTPGAMA